MPSFQLPGFDGVGANQYIVDLTHQYPFDFVPVGDTSWVWETSIWHHALNRVERPAAGAAYDHTEVVH